MGLRRVMGSLLFLLTWATPTAGFALQEEPSVANSFPPDGGPVRTIVLGGANANRVTLDIDPIAEQYVITDAAGITAGQGCTPVSSQTVRCTRHPSPREPFEARMRGGDDIFEMRSPADEGLQLRGGDGADTVTGRSGFDRLFGDRGADRLIGGAGRDRLHADDGDPDQAINCGPGRDLAILDSRHDPKPIRCERVRRV
jgi:RTX calcium-binding nonapeptide repeat (4 copies)